MMSVPNRPRRRPPNHPAELDLADRLRELESALAACVECDGDAECRISRPVVDRMLGTVRGMARVVKASVGRVPELAQSR